MKNQYTITKELVKKWAHESCFIGRNRTIFIMYMIVAAAFAAIFVMYAFFVKSSWHNIYISLIMCAITVYKAYPERIINASERYKQLAKLNGAAAWGMVVDFAETEIVVTEGTATVSISYAGISKIVEKKDKYLIFLKSKNYIRIYKDAFVDCTEEECMDYIRSKIGMTDFLKSINKKK